MTTGAFLHPLGNPKSCKMDYFFWLKKNTSCFRQQKDAYIYYLAVAFVELSTTKNSRGAFSYLDGFKAVIQAANFLKTTSKLGGGGSIKFGVL